MRQGEEEEEEEIGTGGWVDGKETIRTSLGGRSIEGRCRWGRAQSPDRRPSCGRNESRGRRGR